MKRYTDKEVLEILKDMKRDLERNWTTEGNGVELPTAVSALIVEFAERTGGSVEWDED